ncbi:hypothetical protein L249_2401 [Ophiocordyceps polyrhachis-furcata BCC 54312]|uniref:Uncharacterized protein n=1 Tax=Ophiocordyceps polyrhachis-furcata BCC 54312 TaxID=1330021 RepID=A0A367LSK1_9HYPO|nr:hypothetical protein L249_2401 [Ophiocordyceps polyrhachis-furcata BCC 54312]
MDAAAKTVQSLSQHILPERPHYLSNSPSWRYRDTGSSRIEEWQNNRLQYMTLVSQADRGFLLTRSHYDMREEPPKPIPRALAAAGDKKKKLSLSDYKNKKTVVVAAAAAASSAASSAASPPDPIVAKPAAPSQTSAADFRRPDALQPPSVDAKMRPPRDGAIDMRLPPKPPSLPPKPTSPPPPPPPPPTAAVKKRLVDADDESRPLKRHKPDDGRPVDRPPRGDDAARRPPHLSGGKDERPPASWHHLNGRPPVVKGGAALSSSSARNSSPGPRLRSDLVNGVRPHSSASNRTSASAKLDAGPKSFGETERLRTDYKRDKKRREDAADVATTSKIASNKAEPLPPPPPPKKNKNPPVIPPLLSPTLPPAVEAELLKKKKKVSSPDRPADDKLKDSRDATKKRAVNDHEPNRLGHRRRLIVVLSIPKALRPAVNKILAPAKEGQSRENRAVSDEAALPLARKRPIGAATEGPVPVKRPRTSDVARVAPTPSTPSKKSATMSRVSSSNSMAQTPGDINGPPHMDRRLPNGQNARFERDMSMLRDKEMHLLKRGKDLKHEWTHTLKALQTSRSQAAEPMVKLRCVLGVESLVAFVMAFYAQSLWRGMSSKRLHPSVWESMFPLIEEILAETSRLPSNSQTLSALVLLMQAVCVDEVLRCYAFADAPTKKEADALFKWERARARLWPQIRDLNGAIAAPDLRLDVGAWYTLDEVTGLAMRLLRRWCAVEAVDWTPEPVVADSWPIKPG